MKIYVIEFHKEEYRYIPEVFWTTSAEAIKFAEKYLEYNSEETYEILMFTKE